MRPIGVKFCTMVELCPGCDFSPFGGDVLRSLQIGGQNGFWTICLQRNVVNFCHKQDSLMRGTFVDSGRRSTRTCVILQNFLYSTVECWWHQQWSMPEPDIFVTIVAEVIFGIMAEASFSTPWYRHTMSDGNVVIEKGNGVLQLALTALLVWRMRLADALVTIRL